MANNRFECEINGVADILYDCAEDINSIDYAIDEWHQNYQNLIDPMYYDTFETFYRAFKSCVNASVLILTDYAHYEMEKE